MKNYTTINKEPKVSVVLAVYNHEKFVGQTIESVIRQSYTDWELIIMDDGSTDRSAEIIRQYQDERIRFYQAEKNKGTVRTFNELLEKVRGEYVAVIDADDIWYGDKLRKQVEYMDQNRETAVCFSWAEFMDEEGRLYAEMENGCDYDIQIFMQKNRSQGEILRHFFEHANYFCNPSALIRFDAVKEIGKANPRYRQLHDFDYWVRILQKHPVYLISEPLVRYRRISTENTSLSAVNKQNKIRFMNEIQEIVCTMIKEMDKDLFCEAFRDRLKKEVTNEIQLICEKYFVLLSWNMMGVNNRQPACCFLKDLLDEDVIRCLETEYQYSIHDYYEELGNVWKLYPFDFYQEYERLNKEYEALKKAYQAQEKAVNRLNGEIQGMSRTLSWRITKPLREVKRLAVKKRK